MAVDEAADKEWQMGDVGRFVGRFWVALLALCVLGLVMSPINLAKLAAKVWGWWR